MTRTKSSSLRLFPRRNTPPTPGPRRCTSGADALREAGSGDQPKAAEPLTSLGRDRPASRLSPFAGFSVPSLGGRSEGLRVPSAGRGAGLASAHRLHSSRGAQVVSLLDGHIAQNWGAAREPCKDTPLTATDSPGLESSVPGSLAACPSPAPRAAGSLFFLPFSPHKPVGKLAEFTANLCLVSPTGSVPRRPDPACSGCRAQS